jgi:hypothetical protein
MNASFVSPSWPPALRKTLRLTTPAPLRTKRNSSNTGNTDLTETMRRDALRVDPVLLQNLEFLDREYGHDEFNDIDNEYEGLTLTEPMSEVELYLFCTGYNVL